MAAGADLPLLAVAATAGYFVVAYGYPALARRLPTDAEPSVAADATSTGAHPARGADALHRLGFAVADVSVRRCARRTATAARPPSRWRWRCKGRDR